MVFRSIAMYFSPVRLLSKISDRSHMVSYKIPAQAFFFGGSLNVPLSLDTGIRFGPITTVLSVHFSTKRK